MMRVDIRGPIIPNNYKDVYDYFGMESTAPIDIRKAVEKASGEQLDIYIDSGGGEIHAGSNIYTDLMSYQSDVNIYVIGLAASSASVIAMAGKLLMSPTAMMMVHNVAMVAGGDYREMDKASEVLKQANRSMAAAYVAKSGMSEKEALAMMDKETWITAQKAVELKLSDGIMFQEQQPLVADYNSGLLSIVKVNEIKEKIKSQFEGDAKRLVFDVQQQKINLLKLKGEIKK